MNSEDLSPELIERGKNCKTPEEIFELVKAEGIELSDEQLEAIGGGVDKSNGDGGQAPSWG